MAVKWLSEHSYGLNLLCILKLGVPPIPGVLPGVRPGVRPGVLPAGVLPGVTPVT